MDNRELISKGKRLAYLLRHDKSYQFVTNTAGEKFLIS